MSARRTALVMFLVVIATLTLVTTGVVGDSTASRRIAGEVDAAREGGPAQADLVQAADLPPAPPVLLVAGTQLDPLYLSWLDAEDDLHTVTPPADATAADYPAIRLGDVFEAQIDSPERPAVINARFFHRVGASGLPSDTEDSFVECLGSSPGCTVQYSDVDVRAQFEVDPAAVFVVVEVFYDNPGIAPVVPYSVTTYGFNASVS